MIAYLSGMFRCAVNGVRMHTDEPIDMMLSFAYLQDNPAGQDQLATLRRIERERAGKSFKPTPDKNGVVGLRNPVNCGSHFLDSGAFTQRKQSLAYHKATGKGPFAFYATNEFWDYVWDYCQFVKSNPSGVDLYSNVDVIPHAELTWKVQQYMEREHGLYPVPVVHFRSDLKWLRHYIDRGYPVISLGGVSGKTKDPEARRWLNSAFLMACPESRSGAIPTVKLHGFGLSRFDIMMAYPWWSVDSSTWTSTASYGGIFVPVERGGRFVFTESPYVVRISIDSPDKKLAGRHYLTMSRAERRVVDKWLDEVGVPLGEVDEDGDIKTYGVMTRHSERRAVNYAAFKRVADAVPKWPWPWHPNKVVGGGLGLKC